MERETTSRIVTPYTEDAQETAAAIACFMKDGVGIKIPNVFLWGRQARHEYSRSRLASVRRALREGGKTFLENHPISAVFVYPPDSPHFVPIFDGHHRTRMAPAFGIREIPARVVLIDQLAQAINRDPNDLEEVFAVQTSTAFADFWEKRRDLTRPRYIDSCVRSVEDLARYFQDRACLTPSP